MTDNLRMALGVRTVNIGRRVEELTRGDDTVARLKEEHRIIENAISEIHALQPKAPPMSMTKRELQPEETQELLQEEAQADDRALAERTQEAQALAWRQGACHAITKLGVDLQAPKAGYIREANPYNKEPPF